MNKRIWSEILSDFLALLWAAITSPKGIELLDELAEALHLPDPFPNVDGSSWDDEQGEQPQPSSVTTPYAIPDSQPKRASVPKETTR